MKVKEREKVERLQGNGNGNTKGKAVRLRERVSEWGETVKEKGHETHERERGGGRLAVRLWCRGGELRKKEGKGRVRASGSKTDQRKQSVKNRDPAQKFGFWYRPCFGWLARFNVCLRTRGTVSFWSGQGQKLAQVRVYSFVLCPTGRKLAA